MCCSARRVRNLKDILTPARDTIAHIETAKAMIPDVPCGSIFGLVVYDLPGRDCAAKASNGELAVGEDAKYQTSYIDRKYYNNQELISKGG
jgi:cellulase/cellobiase CelA1